MWNRERVRKPDRESPRLTWETSQAGGQGVSMQNPGGGSCSCYSSTVHGNLQKVRAAFSPIIFWGLAMTGQTRPGPSCGA